MLVGKSGAGKSVLGNKLLNAGGADGEFEHFFEERGGAEGVTMECTRGTSRNRMLRVIDTPGSPDPNTAKTSDHFNAIVKEIREVDSLNLLIFLAKEDRTTEREFSHYQVLLKQFNHVPCQRLMVCRQPDFARRPSVQDKEKKAREGLDFVRGILHRSGMDMPCMLYRDGSSEAAELGLDKIISYANVCPLVRLRGCPMLKTVGERQRFVLRLCTMVDRAKALKQQLEGFATSVKIWQTLNTVCGVIGSAGELAMIVTDGTSGIVTAMAGGVIYFNDKHIGRIQEKEAKARQELESGHVDESLLNEAKEELDGLESLWKSPV